MQSVTKRGKQGMKKNRPRSQKVMIIIETLAVFLFSLGLYWNLCLYLEIKGLNQACASLEKADGRLERLNSKIRSFEMLKKTLIPHDEKGLIFTWENVEIQFEPIEFSHLLARLSLLNSEIENKYHKRGLFVLTRFETVEKAGEAGEQNPDSKTGKTSQKPGFKIEGKLLCL